MFESPKEYVRLEAFSVVFVLLSMEFLECLSVCLCIYLSCVEKGGWVGEDFLLGVLANKVTIHCSGTGLGSLWMLMNLSIKKN